MVTAAVVGSVTGLSFPPQIFGSDGSSNPTIPTSINPSLFPNFFRNSLLKRPSCALRVSVSSGPKTEGVEQAQDSPATTDSVRQARRSADWKAARTYKESGFIYDGRIEGFNGGGLLVRFYSLLGFVPYPHLSPSRACKEPEKNIQLIAKGLVGSRISVKVIQADEENRKLIFSEKEVLWSKFSPNVKVGDIFEARVGSIEDYGAFVHLLFPDGYYHLTGLVHVSEVSWDLVQDVRDIINVGDNIKVKVIQIDREKSRVTLSIKQLEDDPLLETLDKVIPQDGPSESDNSGISGNLKIEPLPGLDIICGELLQEDGYDFFIACS
ncbi:30S ribosomal protein S1-like [Macadamia integrifolia]|uniref:30S ribosomal protein S1-like n=1 Tax=Macadamia integrifolia TaxID=60698 RepID=UPI001C4E34AB|nr:30S ribosomal protein S1-like [Macadamia integrifolia]